MIDMADYRIDEDLDLLGFPSHGARLIRRTDTPPYAVSAPEWTARWGDSPPPVGTVLRVLLNEGTFDESATVAICVGDDVWNSSSHPGPLTFAVLARYIANLPVTVAVGWREVPRVEPRASGDEAVLQWAAQFIEATDA